jgi:hypothetical protein
VESEHGLLDENVRVIEVESVSKTQLHETEVEKAKEANDIYEVQINRSEEHIMHAIKINTKKLLVCLYDFLFCFCYSFILKFADKKSLTTGGLF